MGMMLCFAALALTTTSCNKESEGNVNNTEPREDIRYTMWYGENELGDFEYSEDLSFYDNTYVLYLFSKLPDMDPSLTIFKGQYTYFKGNGSLKLEGYSPAGQYFGIVGTATFTVSGNNLTLKLYDDEEHHLEFTGENYTPLK